MFIFEDLGRRKNSAAPRIYCIDSTPNNYHAKERTQTLKIFSIGSVYRYDDLNAVDTESSAINFELAALKHARN